MSNLHFLKGEKFIMREKLTAKVTENKKKLEALVTKKANIEREIENLKRKIENQEFTISHLRDDNSEKTE
jgi:predicted transglutaminase-like protease